jgi:hypothetical protein
MKAQSKWYRDTIAQHQFELASEQSFALIGDSKNTRTLLRKGAPPADARYFDWLEEQGKTPKGRLL